MMIKKTRYSLFVGINNYKNINNLNYCVKDSKDLKKCIDSYNGGFDNCESELLNNEKANKNDILYYLHNFSEKCKENDTFIFYFAGHGDNNNIYKKLGLNTYDTINGSGDLIYDTSLKFETLKNIIKKCKAKYKIIILDSCYSGTGRNIEKNREIIEIIKRELELPNVICICSCQENELSNEDEYLENGIFTHYLVESIKKGLEKNNESIHLEYIFEYVLKKMKEIKDNDQKPKIINFGNYKLKDYIICTSTKKILFENVIILSKHEKIKSAINNIGLFKNIYEDVNNKSFNIMICDIREKDEKIINNINVKDRPILFIYEKEEQKKEIYEINKNINRYLIKIDNDDNYEKNIEDKIKEIYNDIHETYYPKLLIIGFQEKTFDNNLVNIIFYITEERIKKEISFKNLNINNIKEDIILINVINHNEKGSDGITWEEKRKKIIEIREKCYNKPIILLGYRNNFLENISEDERKKYIHYYFIDINENKEISEETLKKAQSWFSRHKSNT